MFTNLRKTQRAYHSLSTALLDFETQLSQQAEQSAIDNAIKRGYFKPDEDDALWSLVSRFLTIRNGFWEVINDMSAHFSDDIENVTSKDDWRHFLLGYASSCQAVRMAKMLIENLAYNRLVQRKINEGSPQNRIPKKVFTQIYQSLSDTDNAIKMQYMINFVEANKTYINSLNKDEYVADIVNNLEQLEAPLHTSQRVFLKLRLRYLWHALTRRFAVSKQVTSFFILEKAGRVIADIGVHDKNRVTTEVYDALSDILKPGDVIITRHDFVASNLFLPGYWPHAALYIGSEQDRNAFNINVSNDIAHRWCGSISVLEAKKDGVLFRPLSETMEVDEFIIIRPSLSSTDISTALTRIVAHEGKGYNFDFDFFRSDQLVCTEVVFRAFDGLGDIQFELIERAGRLSLSAEDLLDSAVHKRGFKPVAAFGFNGCQTKLLSENTLQLTQIIKNSYFST